MRRALLALALISAATALPAQISDGDQHWAARAEGASGGHASAAKIDAAIAAYQRVAAANLNDLESRWKLMRAIRFKGAYAVRSNEEKKQVFAEGKKVGEQAMAIVDRLLAAKGIKSVAKTPEKDVAVVARSIPHAGEAFYWDAVNWGEWALVFGKLAAVRQGAADRIRRETTIAMLVDPRMEDGGGARVLGRLHNQTPRVPFLTGWASDELAVKYLRQALAVQPNDKVTKVFLAEAMVADDSRTRAQAVQILREVIDSPNDPNFLVEGAAAQDDARALLRQWNVK